MPSSSRLEFLRANPSGVNFFLRAVALIALSSVFALRVSAANNPVPFVDIVSPVSINPGSTAVTLTVRGTGFVSSSTIDWNGKSLSTTFVNVGTQPQGLLTADFNADGKSDLAVANKASNNVSILLSNGDGTFTTKSTSSAGTGANWLAAGDFNEDGKLDLAVAHSGSTGAGGVSVFLGNGDGTFTLKSSPNTGGGPSSVVAEDFNADGHLDLAVINETDGTVAILLGAGDGTFSAGNTLTVGTNSQVIVAGDFNEDGGLDLAVSNKSD